MGRGRRIRLTWRWCVVGLKDRSVRGVGLVLEKVNSMDGRGG